MTTNEFIKKYDYAGVPDYVMNRHIWLIGRHHRGWIIDGSLGSGIFLFISGQYHKLTRRPPKWVPRSKP
jgi:hypothetical protein